APLDYKFAEYPGHVYHNQKVQSALYGLLIQETFQKPIARGFVCYLRSSYRIVTLEFSEVDFDEAREIVREVLEVIQRGIFPKATRWKARCADCCYRNICIK